MVPGQESQPLQRLPPLVEAEAGAEEVLAGNRTECIVGNRTEGMMQDKQEPL